MKFNSRIMTLFALLLMFILLPMLPSASAAPPSGSRYFSQTGYTVQGGFLTFFDQHGGVPIFGYPITNEITENGLTVQYFQRARFEWYPNNQAGAQVLLGLLGEQLHGPAAPRALPIPSTPSRQVRYFSETGHNVSNIFLDYWTRHGQLTVFGYPLSEAYIEGSTIYQWFQRARFEYRHGRVELGLLGQEWLTKRGATNQGVTAPPPTSPSASTSSRSNTDPSRNISRSSLPSSTSSLLGYTGRTQRFSQTNHLIQGPFLDFWQRHGAQARLGYPISGEFIEESRTVQYFEYARLEWHPYAAPGQQVKLGAIGLELHGPVQEVVAPTRGPNQRYFPQTGHSVSNEFLRKFDSGGGVDSYGYPLGEAEMENGEIVQWFERRKLAFRNNQVVDVPLGKARFNPNAVGQFVPQQIFYYFLSENGAIRGRIGPGFEDAKNVKFFHQTFEGGQMFWREDTNQIYTLFNNGSWRVYENPWREGKALSGGYSPPRERYEPQASLGEIWRSLGGPGSPLGWATAPQGETIAIGQRFWHGTLIYNPLNERLYILYNGAHWFDMANQWTYIKD